MQFTYKILENKSLLERLNNGDIAFCKEDHSISLKYNNEVHTFGGIVIDPDSGIEIDSITPYVYQLAYEYLKTKDMMFVETGLSSDRLLVMFSGINRNASINIPSTMATTDDILQVLKVGDTVKLTKENDYDFSLVFTVKYINLLSFDNSTNIIFNERIDDNMIGETLYLSVLKEYLPNKDFKVIGKGDDI